METANRVHIGIWKDIFLIFETEVCRSVAAMLHLWRKRSGRLPLTFESVRKAMTTGYFSLWQAPALAWINVSPRDFDINLNRLVDTNPIIAAELPRNCGFSQAELRSRVFARALEIVARDFPRFTSDASFQLRLEFELTKYLAELHYSFLLRSKGGQERDLAPMQFWWLASYLICRKGNNGFFRFHFISEEFFHEEFYENGKGRCRPSLLIEEVGPETFMLVPFTNSPGDGKFVLGNSYLPERSKFAIYKFYFIASRRMFDIGRTRNRKPFSISPADFDQLKQKIRSIGN